MDTGGFVIQEKGNKEISFKELVLEHQRRILKISCREFTKTDYTKIYPSYTEEIKGTDNGLNFIQSVEVFALLLYPHFDEEMETKYNKLKRYFNCSIAEFRVIGKVRIENFIEKFYNGKNLNTDEISHFLRHTKINHSKLLFLELNKLLKRVNYLKDKIYDEEKESESTEVQE